MKVEWIELEWIEKAPNWHQAEPQGYVLQVTQSPESEWGWELWIGEQDYVKSDEPMTLEMAKNQAVSCLVTVMQNEACVRNIFEKYRAKSHSILGGA